MSKYFQYSKDKKLKTTNDSPTNEEVKCCNRRMRELSLEEYDHEAIQRAYVESGGDIPADTDLMTSLNI